ncbi:MAG: acetate--CoA ligase, partial [Litorivicinus sp.]
MSDQKVYPVSAEWAASAWADEAKYNEMYAESVNNPDAFWGEQARASIDWIKPFTQVKNTSFAPGNVSVKWFEDGTLNVAANCLDRHLAERGDQTAIIWEGDDPNADEHITYRDLYERVGKFANALKAQGVKKGDVATIYMPMIPEAAVAMLACARIGAVHSIVFGGFSPDALGVRVEESGSSIIITADEGRRGGRRVPLKKNVDAAIAGMDNGALVKSVVVVKCTGGDVAWDTDRDHWYHELVADQSVDCPAEEMGAEDPLFILYTSGSTGKPKGLEHTTGGYIVYASMTHKYVFDYKDGDVYWCTADVGWVTGHSYIVYGPLANGGTTLMFEGVPTYPDASRFGRVIEKHKVNQFYTAPTAIRALMQKGDDVLGDSDLSSLKLLGSVGEPINPEAWNWYNEVIGKGECPIVDTWWQTETGGIMIVPLPGATAAKPGSATRPFFGVQPALVDNEGNLIEGAADG